VTYAEAGEAPVGNYEINTEVYSKVLAWQMEELLTRDSQQIRHHFAGTRQGQLLLVHQIDADRLDRWSKLQRDTDLLGKDSDRGLLARRTLLVLGLMLPHPQARRRQVEHLPPFHRTGTVCARSCWQC
jgi:hypothetical protein